MFHSLALRARSGSSDRAHSARHGQEDSAGTPRTDGGAGAELRNFARDGGEVSKPHDTTRPESYDPYMKSYGAMAAAYPQVLISQRTLFQLQ